MVFKSSEVLTPELPCAEMPIVKLPREIHMYSFNIVGEYSGTRTKSNG